MGGAGSWVALLIIGLLATILVYEFSVRMAPSQISWSYFENLIEGRDFKGDPIRDIDGNNLSTNIEKITWVGEEAVGPDRLQHPAGGERSGDRAETVEEHEARRGRRHIQVQGASARNRKPDS